MPDQVTNQQLARLFSQDQAEPSGKPTPETLAVKQARPTRKHNTIAFLLEELQNKSKTIPETFESVDRSLPTPPAPAILRRAVENCQTVFLDISEINKTVKDLRVFLLEAICNFADENQRLSCAAYMAEFETRMIENYPLSAALEINQSYLLLARLLSEKPTERSLPWQSRLLAVQHFLSHAAKPETVSQGNKIGSQIICLIYKLICTKPARLAEIMLAAAIKGEHAAFDGRCVSVDEHSLKPGAEELLYKAGDNRRSFACKILQCMLMNNCLPRRSRPMSYSESPGRPGKEYGGQIVKTVDGELINPKLGANLSFLELALLARYEFGERHCVIVNNSSFSAESGEMLDLFKQNLLVHINSADELAQALQDARESGRIPVSIAVDERRLLADTYRDGINHCINVIHYNEYGLLKIFNPQLLPGMPRVSRLNLQKLYTASFSPIK